MITFTKKADPADAPRAGGDDMSWLFLRKADARARPVSINAAFVRNYGDVW